MGNYCGCLSVLKVETPRQLTPSQHTLPSTRRSKPKFQDIIPEESQEGLMTERDLNIWSNQLSTYLLRFQQKNGALSKRSIHKYSEEQEQNIAQIDFSAIFPTQPEKQQCQQRQSNELYLPLTNHNIDVRGNCSQFSSNAGTPRNNESMSSCLLSEGSQILNNSIFTERMKWRKQFYLQFNKIGEIQLQQWLDRNRLSFQLYFDEFIEFQQTEPNPKIIICLQTIDNYWNDNNAHLMSYSINPSGIKLSINGQRRLFTIDSQQKQPTLQNINSLLCPIFQNYSIVQLIYLLTGWIPQQISMNQIKNYMGILQRLANNSQQGNTLISFTRNTVNKEQTACFKKIDFVHELVYLDTVGLKLEIPDVLMHPSSDCDNNLMVLTFQNFVELFDSINLNWNPMIYDVRVSRQGIIDKNQKNVIKYLLVIPPSSQDIQIRLFLQKHINPVQVQNNSKLWITLYQFQQFGDFYQNESIRKIHTTNSIYSDVFIFQSCKEKTQYILTVTAQEDTMIREKQYFTLTLFSFVDMSFQDVQPKTSLKQICFKTHIKPENTGFGINSPFFVKNMQFSIETELKKQLSILVKSSKMLKYQICLIPDINNSQNLTKINLEQIINNSIISGEKKGSGSFSINTEHRHYIMLINSYSSVDENIQIHLNLFNTKKSNAKQSFLTIKQIRHNPNVIFLQEIKWLPNHSGPRKRLKSNSTQEFQPANTFTQFFKNPYIDRTIQKGKYQFFVRSQTFRDYFQSLQLFEDKNQCQPPALSMAIFLMNKNKQQFKIIVDDAFYVPFGVGFWSVELELQEGHYRFICPKIQKDFSKGTYGIIKC